MAKFQGVRVGKIDLDTCGVGYLAGITRKVEVQVLRSAEASQEDLADPSILCVEVGGSGRVAQNNFDHHGEGSEGLSSATLQAWNAGFYSVSVGVSDRQFRLVDYIDRLDTQGVHALGRRQKGKFPTLSDLFAGMLLTERDPVEQFHLGVDLLAFMVDSFQDPFGRIKGEIHSKACRYGAFRFYGSEGCPCPTLPSHREWAEAKTDNNRQMAKAVKKAHQGLTAKRLKLAWLETDFFGAPGALYGVGAQVVVAFSPRFGPDRVPKFTIAGNGIRVDAVLSELNARESGWGGPGTGTIIGSPREGSAMTLDEVVAMVRRIL